MNTMWIEAPVIQSVVNDRLNVLHNNLVALAQAGLTPSVAEMYARGERSIVIILPGTKLVGGKIVLDGGEHG